MLNPSAETPASRAGLRIAASVGGALVLFLGLVAIVRPEMMGMAHLAKVVSLGWWPS